MITIRRYYSNHTEICKWSMSEGSIVNIARSWIYCNSFYCDFTYWNVTWNIVLNNHTDKLALRVLWNIFASCLFKWTYDVYFHRCAICTVLLYLKRGLFTCVQSLCHKKKKKNPESLTKTRSKMKSLSSEKHFIHYKSTGAIGVRGIESFWSDLRKYLLQLFP